MDWTNIRAHSAIKLLEKEVFTFYKEVENKHLTIINFVRVFVNWNPHFLGFLGLTIPTAHENLESNGEGHKNLHICRILICYWCDPSRKLCSKGNEKCSKGVDSSSLPSVTWFDLSKCDFTYIDTKVPWWKAFSFWGKCHDQRHWYCAREGNVTLVLSCRAAPPAFFNCINSYRGVYVDFGSEIYAHFFM